MNNLISKLRNRENVTLFDKKDKIFHHLQINKKEPSFICWERHVSKDRRNWIKWNEYLSLRDISHLQKEIISQLPSTEK